MGAAVGPAGAWPEDRVRRGLVMGAVQSGKTGSMFGVAAKSLDAGVDVLVVLSGTRLSLWRQTLDRFQAQLDLPLTHAARERARILRPAADQVGLGKVSRMYEVQPARVRRARHPSRRSPLVFFALKQTDHLHALATSLRTNVFPQLSDADFHMLVLDDEADDGSVLDAAVEASEDPVYGNLKQIPRSIASLWRPTEHTNNMHTTYLAYTATPQANFLQDHHNPLAPRDFVMSLRTPADVGELVPRSSTYREPQGLPRMYTGGEMFYRRGGAAGLCLPTEDDLSDELIRGLRAFLVAGAVRFLAQPGKAGPSSARACTFSSREEATAACIEPHSMLIHPAAAIAEHRQVALDLLTWGGARTPAEAAEILKSGVATLPHTVAQDLLANEAQWQAWLDEFRSSARALALEFAQPQPAVLPAWEDVRRALLDELIPGTRVSVVNSHPDSDDRPEYEPGVGDGTWLAPRDLCTIFVSGNVMSRGITLEGLTTTLFLRGASQPLADTQMQMQRWFGFRGEYLHLCRLLAPAVQLRQFASYHDTDEALRQFVIGTMNHPKDNQSALQVLHGRDFLATGKIANLGQFPLVPGPAPFVALTNAHVDVDPNLSVVAGAFPPGTSVDVMHPSTVRGRIGTEPLSLLDAAALLDSLSYTDYRPGTSSRIWRMWNNVHSRVCAHSPAAAPRPFYTPPEVPAGSSPSVERADCPYAIAAYLRLWDACLTRHVRGLFSTDRTAARWSMTDLASKRQQQPRFWVGIRYGEGPPAEPTCLKKLDFTIRSTSRKVVDGQLDNAWGSRDPDAGPQGYRGDDFFDYYHRGEAVPSDGGWRSPGTDGQILFFVNQEKGQTSPSVAVGVCIPSGGPDQIAALTNTLESS
ncbi:Z1 domain-containing protein [Nocardioides pantholopis]|uniref:Z1 domain-containing protein n=1 Tax=Nocardioides pantholopis TaxID=2483798 RepID=UPI0013E3FD86|nr:Z1 domain-containing protein [Nocardioides pantholopis]